MINLPPLKIGNLEIITGIIQGGMGVGVSIEGLASAVAEQGGAGIIASVGLGFLKGYFQEELKSARKKGKFNKLSGVEIRKLKNQICANANSVALAEEIRKAKNKTNGVVGVNIMSALTDRQSLIETAIREKVKMMIIGAGVMRNLPKYVGEKDIKLIPIVSDVKGARVICKAWGKHGHFPDAIIVEGPKAGGHLGYSKEQLQDPDFVSFGLETILQEVIEKVDSKIPVIAAGGIYTGQDIYNLHKQSVAGVQMATRFVTTHECDADVRFKQAYINSNEEDIVLIDSPVGMPGRVIENPFTDKIKIKRIPFNCRYKCLRTCDPKKSRYCIAEALVNAQRGDFEKGGFAFAGTNAPRAKEIISVKDLFSALEREYNLGC